jgi:hypothetical protein
MEIFSYKNLNEFSDIFKTGDFFIIGEMHGILENALLIQDLLDIAVKTNRAVSLAFEWLLNIQEVEDLQNYIRGTRKHLKIPKFFTDSDGRVTATHLELLKKIHEHNRNVHTTISVTTFDSPYLNREQNMAQNLINFQIQNNSIVIVETGSFHAQRFTHNSVSISMNDILNRSAKSINIFLKYEEGTVQVEDTIYDVHDSEMQNEDQSNHFDYTILIPIATAATDNLLLTELEKFSNLKK